MGTPRYISLGRGTALPDSGSPAGQPGWPLSPAPPELPGLVRGRGEPAGGENRAGGGQRAIRRAAVTDAKLCPARVVREGVKSELLFRSSCFPERRKERLARKPSISNQSNLPVIICDQHQITPARHDPSSLRCNGPLYGCVYTGGGRGEKGRERKRERESVCVDVCARGEPHHSPQWESPPPPALGERSCPSQRSPKLLGRG